MLARAACWELPLRHELAVKAIRAVCAASQVLSWKGRFGWIRADKRINHQESAKHGGRIYVHISDVDGREELTENARVSFMAYSDGDGLGAEQVRAESQLPPSPAYPTGAASVVKTRAVPPAQQRSSPGAGPGQSASSAAKSAAKASATVAGPLKPKPKPHPCPARLKALLPSDCCCPISLTSLEELPVDPFGLLGTTESAEVPKEGIWGEAAEELLRANPNQVIHWFDGRFLASFLVSSGQLIDPVNRRELSRGECRSLDEYICAHGCPAVHVADAFDLANAVKTTTQAEGPAAVRMAALEREAASMLRSLFDFRSVRNVPQPAWQTTPEPGAESDALQASEQSASDWPVLGASSQDSGREPASIQPERRIRTCTRRTVHNDGGLQVVDDTEFDEEYEEDEDEPLFGPTDPTLAESASAPRRARAARLPRSRGDRAQITFSVTGRARAEPTGEGRVGGQAGSSQMRLSTQLEDSEGDDHQEDDHIPPPLEVEAWVPEWATPDLHERLLTEIDVVSAMFPDECQVLTQDVQAYLQECLSNGLVSRRPDPLRVQVAQHVDGPNGGCTVYLEFSLPPFYPLHEPSLTLKAADEGAPVWMRDALQSLQGTLRTELHNLEGSEVMVKAVEWLTQHGPTAFARERESSHVNKAAPAKKQAPAVSQQAVESKAERIEQARRERLSAKFTDKWDLCYAFIKHGSCKDKNCQWRHELPPKKEETKEVKETKVETKAKQGAGKKKSKA